MSAVDLDALIAELRTPIRVQYEEKPNHVLRRANVSRLNAAKALEDLRRAPVSAGKAKALVWGKWGDAKGGGAKYSVYEFGGRGLWNCVCYPHGDQQYRLAYGVSQEAAKAAAQADYEARILSALQPGDGWQGITRVDLIDHSEGGTGLAFTKRGISVTLDVQDGGRTLKVFVAPPASLPQGEEAR